MFETRLSLSRQLPLWQQRVELLRGVAAVETSAAGPKALAQRDRSIEQIREFIGADTLGYLSIRGVLAALESGKYKHLRINYANGDMVGHTGKLDAAIRAVETLDGCIGRVVAAHLQVELGAAATIGPVRVEHRLAQRVRGAARQRPRTGWRPPCPPGRRPAASTPSVR